MAFLVVALVALVFGFVGSMPMAGPVEVVVVSRAVERRYGEALRVGLGAAAAEGAYALLAFWGFATFLARHERVLPFAHGVTAIVLLGLGGYFMRWRAKDCDEEDRKDDRSEKKRKAGPFFLGFTLAGINPTLLLTWSAAVAALYSKQIVKMESILSIPFGVAAALGVGAWNLVLVKLLEAHGQKLPCKALTWIVRSMGLLLVVVALWSAVELALYIIHGGPHRH